MQSLPILVCVLGLVGCGAEPPTKPTVPETPPNGAAGAAAKPDLLIQDWIKASEKALATRTHANADRALAQQAQSAAVEALRSIAATAEGRAAVGTSIEGLMAELNAAHKAAQEKLHNLKVAARVPEPAEQEWMKSAPAELEALARKAKALATLKDQLLKR